MAEVIRDRDKGQWWDYLPFGEQIPTGIGGRSTDYGPALFPGAPDDVLKKFTGKERDAESGLDYFGARYFSSAEGRFTSADWSAKPEPVPYANLEDPQTLNLYGYVRNNPLSKPDLDGHCLEDACVIEGAAVGTGVLYGGAAIAGAVGLTGVAVTLHNSGDAIISGAKSLIGSIGGLIFQSESKPEAKPASPTQAAPPANTNPYAGPVAGPVTVVDGKGNAVPVGAGQSLTGSKDGKWTQVRGADGQPTGTRVDGGHPEKTHADPRAQEPHAHVPGKTNPDGTPWLPVNK